MTSGTEADVAVLGTGTMGTPIARRLLDAGFSVRVWNRTAARAQPLAADGANVTTSPSEAADGARVVLTMLSDGEAVEHAMLGRAGALAGDAPRGHLAADEHDRPPLDRPLRHARPPGTTSSSSTRRSPGATGPHARAS